MRSFGPRDREPAFPAHVAPFIRMHRHTTRGTDRLSSGREIVEEHAISVVLGERQRSLCPGWSRCPVSPTCGDYPQGVSNNDWGLRVRVSMGVAVSGAFGCSMVVDRGDAASSYGSAGAEVF